jgi:hypothetical protein
MIRQQFSIRAAQRNGQCGFFFLAILTVWSLEDMIDKHGLLFARAILALSEAKLLCFPIQLQPGERNSPPPSAL